MSTEDTGNDPFAALKASEHWEQAKAYADQRIRGVAAERDQHATELEQLRQQVDASGNAGERAEELQGSIDSFTQAMIDELSPETARLIPTELSGPQLLAWLARNRDHVFAPRRGVSAGQARGGRPASQDQQLSRLRQMAERR